MPVSVLGALVARDRRSDRVALRVAARERAYSYRDFCTTAWKVGHALGHLGVHAGSEVALAPDPAPQPLLTLFGAACLGARATFDAGADARVVLVPADREGDADARPGRKVVVYGDAPDGIGITHWEETVWSENPAMPPGERSGDEVALDAGGAAYTHRELLAAADGVVDAFGLDAETSVALRAPLTDPRAVVAGVIAPLLAGGTVVLPDGDASADVTVVADEGGRLSVADVVL